MSAPDGGREIQGTGGGAAPARRCLLALVGPAAARSLRPRPAYGLRTGILSAPARIVQGDAPLLFGRGLDKGRPLAASVPGSFGRSVPVSVALLRRIGFQPSGTFALDTTGRVIILRDRLPCEPGLYAFVDRGVAYIGHTAQGTLDQRVRSYLREKYHAHRAVGPALLAALKERGRVRIMTLPVRPRLWKELEITDTFGIEQALLKRLEPPWN